ncbi:hypothetical protein ABBQ32_003865 [Trebouxia sp. C0010 RCD-2024]
MHAETPYLQALREHSGNSSLPAIVELLSLRVSATCVLSHSRADSDPKHGFFRSAQGSAAAIHPPTSPTDQPVAAVEEADPPAAPTALSPDVASTLNVASSPPNSLAREPLAELATQQPAAQALLDTPSTAPIRDPSTVPHTDHTSATNGVDAAAAAAATEPVCPACLGVLQTPARGLHAVPPAMLAGLPEAEGNAGSWQTCTSGSCEALAQQEGHIATTIGLDITLPAACITRQLALWHHLRNKFASEGLYRSPQMFQEVVDLKEALRWMVAGPLSQQLGVQCDREGDLRIMLAYLHPTSSSETDFLFINGGGGKGRGYKRKRGQPKILYAGRSASDTVVQQANRLSHSCFLQHCKSPPGLPGGGVQMAYRVWRRPLYVAGRYLKLLRGVAQSPWIIDGQRKGESSVEERIADAVLPHFKADRHKFMTAGQRATSTFFWLTLSGRSQ